VTEVIQLNRAPGQDRIDKSEDRRCLDFPQHGEGITSADRPPHDDAIVMVNVGEGVIRDNLGQNGGEMRTHRSIVLALASPA
jgi:hypothetical protein